MKKIKLIKTFNNMGTNNNIYYISNVSRSYGYDIFDEKFNFSFGFGHSLKNEFTNYLELEMTFFEKLKLFIIQYIFIVNGKTNKLFGLK